MNDLSQQSGMSFNASSHSNRFTLRQYLHLKPDESIAYKNILQKIVSDQLSSFPSSLDTSFFSLHRQIGKWKNIVSIDKSKETLESLDRLTRQFEALILQSEVEGLRPFITKQIIKIAQQFQELRPDYEVSDLQIHTELASDINEVSTQIEGVVRHLTDTQRMNGIKGHLDSISDKEELNQFFVGKGFAGLHTKKTLEIDKDIVYQLNELVSQFENFDLTSSMLPTLERSEFLEEFDQLFSLFAPKLERLQEDLKNPDYLNSDLSIEIAQLKEIQRILSAFKPTYGVSAPSKTRGVSLWNSVKNTFSSAGAYAREKGWISAHNSWEVIVDTEKALQEKLSNINRSLSESLSLLESKNSKSIAFPDVNLSLKQYDEWMGEFLTTRQLQRALTTTITKEQECTPISLFTIQTLTGSFKKQKANLEEMKTALLKEGMSLELFEQLTSKVTESESKLSELENLILSRLKIEKTIEEDTSLTMLIEHQEELEQGENLFSFERPIAVFEHAAILMQLFREAILTDPKGDDKDTKLFHRATLNLVSQEIKSLKLPVEEYHDEYHDALSAEIARIRIADITDASEQSIAREKLLPQLQEANRQLQIVKSNIDAALDFLTDKVYSDHMHDLLKPIRSMQQKVDDSIESISDQIKSLQKMGPSRMGTWTISSRKYVIKKREEAKTKSLEDDQPPGLGQKILKMCMWGLYLSPQIHQYGAMIGDAVNYWQTGESSSKTQAQQMSDFAFAKESSTLPLEEQEKVGLGINYLQGILEGYIPVTPGIIQDHPSVAHYLEKTFHVELPETTNTELSLLNESPGSYFTPPPLSKGEIQSHVGRFVINHVREHYTATGKQLAWENPRYSFGLPTAVESSVESPELSESKSSPATFFQVLSGEMVQAIKANQNGISSKENPELRNLQKHAMEFFGAELPQEWVEGWIFKQDWSPERLENFSEWLSTNLQVQTLHHIRQMDLHHGQSKPVPLTLVPLTLDATTSELAEVIIPEMRTFTPLTHDEIAFPPATSSASRLTSPLTSIRLLFSTVVGSLFTSSKAAEAPLQALPLQPALIREESELSSWLAFPSFNITPRDMLHLFGEHFGEKSGFEGHTDENILNLFKGMLTEHLNISDNQEQRIVEQKMLDKINQALEFTKLFKEYTPKDVDQVKDFIDKMISNLEAGETTFFPGGWLGKPGHATYYEIIKQKNGSFTFRNYNLGGGAERHTQETFGTEKRHIPFVEFHDIPKDKLLNRAWLNVLAGMMSTSLFVAGWESEDLYDGLLHTLDSKESIITYGSENLELPQHSGICAFISLELALRHQNIPLNMIDRWLFDMRSKAINDFYLTFETIKQHPSKVDEPLQVRMELMTKSLNEFSRQTAIAHEAGLINDHELLFTNSRIQEMKSGLEKMSLDVLVTIFEMTPTLDFNQPTPAAPKIINSDLPSVYIVPPPEVKKTAMRTINFSSWTPTKETVSQDLLSFKQAFAEMLEQEDYISIGLGIRELANRLHLDISDNSIWKQLGKENTIIVVTQLRDMGMIAYESSLKLCHTNPTAYCQILQPQSLMLHVQLMTISHQAMTSLDPEMAKHMTINPSLLNTLRNHPVFIQHYNPGQDTLMQNIITYWDQAFEKSGSSQDGKLFYDPWDNTQSMIGKDTTGGNGWISFIPRINLEEAAPLIWLQDRISKPSRNLLESRFPDYKSLNPLEKVYLALSDYYTSEDHSNNPAVVVPNGRDIFPRYFYDFRDQLHLIALHENVPLDILVSPPERQGGFLGFTGLPDAKEPSSPNEAKFSINYMFFDKKFSNSPTKFVAQYYPLFGLDLAFEWKNPSLEKQLKTGFNSIFDSSLKSIFTITGKSDPKFGWSLPGLPRNSENEALLKKLPDKIDLETFRDLQKLAANPTLQIKETLSYYSEHAHFLSQQDHQNILRTLFFEPGLLTSEMSLAPGVSHYQRTKDDLTQFTEKTCQFIAKNFKLFYSLDNLETAYYFITLNRQFNSYIDQTIENYPEMAHLRTFALDARKEMQAILERKNLNPDLRAMFNQELCLFYENQIQMTPQEAKEMLTAGFLTKQHSIKSGLSSPLDHLAVDRVFYKHADDLKQLLDTQERNSILNTFAEVITEQPVDLTWIPDPAYPYYSSEDGSSTIDLFKGTMNGGHAGKTPTHFLSHHWIKNCFGENIPQSMRYLSKNIVEFNQNGKTFRIITRDYDVDILRSFTHNGKQIWGKWTREVQFTNGIIPEIFKPAHKWILDSSEKVCLITATHDAMPAARIEIDAEFKHHVYQIDKKTGKDTGLKLEPQGNPWNLVGSSFESPDLVAVWVDDDHFPKEIEFPFMGNNGLLFKSQNVNGVVRMVSRDFPGLYLSPHQHLEKMKDDRRFLLLENSKGEKKVIIAQESLMKSDGLKLDDKKYLLKLFIRMDGEHEKLPLHSFSIDQDNGALIPETNGARLYLGLRLLQEMRYQESLDVLKGLESATRPLTDKENGILDSLVNSKAAMNDNSPEAVAISLYAAALSIKYSLAYGRPLNTYYDVPELYTSYLRQESRLFALKLSPEDERLILKSIQSKDYQAQMINRYIELDEATGREAQAKFALNKIKKESGITSPLIFSNQPLFEAKDLAREISWIFSYDEKRGKATKVPLSIEDSELLIYSGYDLATKATKNDLLTEVDKNAFKEITGVDFQQATWKEEFKTALKFMTKSKKRSSRAIGWILLGRLEHTSKLPSALVSSDRESLDLLKQQLESIYDTLYSLYPQIKRPNPFPSGKSPETHSLTTARPLYTQMDNQAPISHQQSIALEAFNPIIQAPTLTGLNQVVSIRKVRNEQTDHTLSTLNKLKSFFSVRSDEEVVQKEFNNVVSNLGNYEKAIENGQLTYSLINQENLDQFALKLKQELIDETTTLRDQEMFLLIEANKAATDPLEATHQDIATVAESKELLTISDLVFLYWKRDFAKFYEHNTNLSPDDIRKQETGIQAMMLQDIHTQKIKRSLDIIDQIKKAQSGNMPQTDIDELVKQLALTVNANQSYDIAEHPEYLAFEYFMKIVMRLDQVKILDSLQIKNGRIGNSDANAVVSEISMGFGKTTVLLPLLALLDADGDHFSIVMMPEALVPSMSKELSDRMGKAYRKLIEVIHFDRSMPTDLSSLDEMQRRLELIRTEGKVAIFTDSSVQSLYLKFLEHFYHYAIMKRENKGDENEIKLLESKIKIFQSIFSMLRTKSKVKIDEFDLIYNARREFHFTLGSAETLQKAETALVNVLYTKLLTDPAIIQSLNVDFSGTDEGEPFSDSSYEKVKPMLIETIIDAKFALDFPETNAFFDTLSPENRNLIVQYLSGSKDTEPTKYVSHLPKLIRSQIALTKQEINVLIPLTFSKKGDINYGLVKTSLFAIPFHGSNAPAIRSQFGNQHETLNYTLQSYLRAGIPKEFVQKEVDTLQAQVLRELAAYPNRGIENTEGYRTAVKLFGEDFSLFNPDMDALMVKINKSVASKLFFTEKAAASSIKIFSLMISSNPHALNFILPGARGMGGTLWNADTYPDNMKVMPAPMIMARTLELLWKNSADKVHTLPLLDPERIAHQLIEDNPAIQNSHALIDTSGAARGVKHEDVAREILSLPSLQNRETNPIRGVCYYDERGDCMVIERGRKDPVPLSQSSLKPEERFTFYDQQHTTGADVKQAANAIGIVTIGEQTLLRDVLQSVWRFRGLDKSQRVEFIVDAAAKSKIFAKLEELFKEKIEGDLTLEHILLFTAYNQGLLQGDNNYRSAKHKMWAILQEEAFTMFIDQNLPLDELADLFSSIEHLFVTKTPTDAWELYGKQEELVDRSTALQNQVEIVAASPAYQALSKEPSQSFKEKIDDIATRAIDLVPRQILTSTNFGIEQEVQQEQEKEVGVEKEKEKEVEKETEGQVMPDNARANTHQPISLSTFRTEIKTATPNNYKEGMIKMTSWKSWTFNLGNIEKPSPFMTAQDALAVDPEMAEFADIFDDNLLTTINMQPHYIPSEGKEGWSLPYAPFNAFQKKFSALLVTQSIETGKLQVTMLDQEDILDVIKSSTNTSGLRQCIFDTTIGVFRQHQKQPVSNEVLTSPAFQRILVQTKFFNGNVHYTEAELEILEVWIKEKGLQRMAALFEEILKWKPETRSFFPHTPLSKLLTA